MNYFRTQKKKVLLNQNVKFYQGQDVYKYTLEKIHKWKGNYSTLEFKHDFIQWLFPSPIPSQFNCDSNSLTEQEAIAFQQDAKIAKNMIKSYKLMLDFYGMELENEITGKIKRSQNYKERYQEAILESSHNLLRISRIMVCLNSTGFRRYAIQLVDHFRKEIYITKKLEKLKFYGSFEKFWHKFGIDYTSKQDLKRQFNEWEEEIKEFDEEEQQSVKFHSEFQLQLQKEVRLDIEVISGDSIIFKNLGDKNDQWKDEYKQIQEESSHFYEEYARKQRLEQERRKAEEEKRRKQYYKQYYQQYNSSSSDDEIQQNEMERKNQINKQNQNSYHNGYKQKNAPNQTPQVQINEIENKAPKQQYTNQQEKSNQNNSHLQAGIDEKLRKMSIQEEEDEEQQSKQDLQNIQDQTDFQPKQKQQQQQQQQQQLKQNQKMQLEQEPQEVLQNLKVNEKKLIEFEYDSDQGNISEKDQSDLSLSKKLSSGGSISKKTIRKQKWENRSDLFNFK